MASNLSGGNSEPVPLPSTVEESLRQICIYQSLSQPLGSPARSVLAQLGEELSLQVLRDISGQKINRSLDGFVFHMAKRARAGDGPLSPSPSPSPVKGFAGRLGCGSSPVMKQALNFNDEGSASSPIGVHHGCSSVRGFRTSSGLRSVLFEALDELEFRKAFLILSYIGKEKLEDVVYVDEIRQLKNLPVRDFEKKVWERLGRRFIKEKDRCKDLEWDSGKTHYYQCHVSTDGTYCFKGPFRDKTKTLLQKILGEDNVLLVKLEGTDRNSSIAPSDSITIYKEIAKTGIHVGSRRYQFFVFKDGGREYKRRDTERDPSSSSVKCYFVRIEGNPDFANKTIHEVRCIFMHAHTVSSISNYMIRFSLILSRTISLEMDFAGVKVQVIPDVECKDPNGNAVYDKKGKPLIHTDGTGYISTDIALKCPSGIFKGCISNQVVEARSGFGEQLSPEIGGSKPSIDEPPLLIQCRLFHEGRAIKGTLLVNDLLKEKTIQVRPSMIKVEKDPGLSSVRTVNSLEVVTTSNKPKAAHLSKTLIALLSYGGVPDDFFLNLLKKSLGDAHSLFSSKRSALKACITYGERDSYIPVRMIMCGIPLEETYLQSYLSTLIDKKSLRQGKILIPDSYYLMGTADPTGSLRPNEVCVILDSGQMSGEVLVYRNPGLHFGDVHVLKATFCEALEAYVGHSRYGIFFPSIGSRSLGDEIAGGDYDGDMYWVSRNRQLLKYFKPSAPWTSASAPQAATPVKPSDLTVDHLEDELINLWLTMRFRPSYAISEAADSWQALMDRYLTIGNDLIQEKHLMKQNILRLIDLYYDALDQPKKGGKIEVPMELKADVFPHYMEKSNYPSYPSSSILGLIYDIAGSYEKEHQTVREVQKLPIFDVVVSEACLGKWTALYNSYRKDMKASLTPGDGMDKSPQDVIQKYKQILYEAAEFEDSQRRKEEIFEEALAIYNITYDYARMTDAGKCAFAWKVAGPALFEFYAKKQGVRSMSIFCLPSILKELS